MDHWWSESSGLRLPARSLRVYRVYRAHMAARAAMWVRTGHERSDQMPHSVWQSMRGLAVPLDPPIDRRRAWAGMRSGSQSLSDMAPSGLLARIEQVFCYYATGSSRPEPITWAKVTTTRSAQAVLIAARLHVTLKTLGCPNGQLWRRVDCLPQRLTLDLPALSPCA